jgi:hypothetical protein
MTTPRETKTRFDIGALEQRVYGVEKAVGEIRDYLASLSTKIDERSRTPWATLIACGGFMLALVSAVGVLAYAPINVELARHENLLAQYQQRYVEGLLKRLDRLETQRDRVPN